MAFRISHLFEFADLGWIPLSLRRTLRESLELGKGRQFRRYYDWAAAVTAMYAERYDFGTIVELGAGTAPLTRRLAIAGGGQQLIISDRFPDHDLLGDLCETYSPMVMAMDHPVDFSGPHRWPDNALLVLSSAFHHVPPDLRHRSLVALASSAGGVLIVEPVRRTFSSVIFVMLGFIPCLMLPVFKITKPGRLRRIFWCWLFPVTIPILLWDAIVSCLRQWPDDKFAESARRGNFGAKVTHSLFTQEVFIRAAGRPLMEDVVDLPVQNSPDPRVG